VFVCVFCAARGVIYIYVLQCVWVFSGALQRVAKNTQLEVMPQRQVFILRNCLQVFTLRCYYNLYHSGFKEQNAIWEYACHPHPWAPVFVCPFSDVCARALLSQTCAFALCMRAHAYLCMCTCVLLFVLSRSGCVFVCICVFPPLWSYKSCRGVE